MSCCPLNIVPFNNESVSVVSYSQTFRDTYGQRPKVQVLYYDSIAGNYYVSNNQSSVRLSGSPTDTITVDHGGSAVGLIKIS